MGLPSCAMPIRDPRSLAEANWDDRPQDADELLREGEELEEEAVVAEAWGVVVRMALTRPDPREED